MAAPELDQLRQDLLAEQGDLDALVARHTEEFHSPTPSPGWTVQDQVGHLAYFDRTAALAITDPDGFAAHVHDLVAGAREHGADAFTLGPARQLSAAELISQWREARDALATAASTLSPDDRVPWYGPSMSARSFLSARLMECWAHGTDIADAVGVHRAPTVRLRHIARLGFLTRGWSYTVRELPVPVTTIRLGLDAPDGATWTFGPDDADDQVSGSAEGFCLVVTQRRHLDDTDLRCGPIGRDWLLRAQAFAGGPTDPPARRR